MADPASPSPASRQEAQGGLVAALLGFSSSLGRHLLAILSLAGLESREAAAVYLRVAAVFIAGLVFAVLGYVLVLFFLAFLLAMVFGVDWIWIALAFAVFHLGVAFFCAMYVRTNISAPVFPDTAAELKKDLEALKNFQP